MLYNIPAGSIATIVGPAEVRVHGSTRQNHLLVYNTGDTDLKPVIDYVAPPSAPLADAPAPISVGGKNFATNAVIVFGGVPFDTVWVSEAMLRASVSAEAAATYEVTVRDGRSVSNIAMFEFT